MKHIAIGPAVEVTEDAVTRAGSQHAGIHIRSAGGKQTVPQGKEECSILDDGPADTGGVLVEVCPVSSGRHGLHAIVRPRVRIQSAVADVPYGRPVESVRA